MKNKPIRITLEHKDESVFPAIVKWTAWREGRCLFVGSGLAKSHWGPAWIYRDHEGYERTVEGNWLDLVAAFKRTAENYGLILCSELS